MIDCAHISPEGRLINITVWADDPQQDGLIPIPVGLPVGIGHYYRNGRFELEDGTEITMPEPVPEIEPEPDAGQAEAVTMLHTVALMLTDEQAVQVPQIYPLWAVKDGHGKIVNYEVGDRRRFGDLLYRCITAHAAQDDWSPGAAVSLWVRIDDPAIEWPEWRQPQGSHDVYAKGAKVTHNGQRWTSDVDGNVWAPGAYGWTVTK